MARNQALRMGPKKTATLAVPRFWMANRPTRMTRLATMVTVVETKGANAGTVFSPSIAESTDMAGVMIESP